MSTLDSTFLILGSVFLSLFFIILTALTIYTWSVIRRLVKGAEAAMNSVEAASNLIREAAHKRGAFMPLVGLLKFIFQTRNNNKKS